MNVDFKGFNENVTTFVADETVEAGVLVSMGANHTVTACTAGSEIVGLCLNVRDGYATVQISGYIEVGSISSVGAGYQNLVAQDGAMVKPGESKRSYLVLHCEKNKIGFIL